MNWYLPGKKKLDTGQFLLCRLITFEEKLMNGKYKITFHGITDRSMEQNPLKKTCSIKIKGQQKQGSVAFSDNLSH